VTPELAAQIVKQYVLPMFDVDKKCKKKKLPSTSVFGDLKLTETLYNELKEIK
jgi:hypothetical protein